MHGGRQILGGIATSMLALTALASCTSGDKAVPVSAEPSATTPSSSPSPTVSYGAPQSFRAISPHAAAWLTLERGGSDIRGTLHLALVQSSDDVARYDEAVTGSLRGRQIRFIADGGSDVVRAQGDYDREDRTIGVHVRVGDVKQWLYFRPGGSASTLTRYVSILQGPGGLRGAITRKILAARATRRVDIDGDGRDDRLSVRWIRMTDYGASLSEVSVRLSSSGRIAHKTVRGDYPQRRPEFLDSPVWLPLARVNDVDGLPGREVVMIDDMGPASYVGRTVLHVADGQLTELPSPPEPAWQWYVGGSLGTGSQVFRCGSGLLYLLKGPPARPRHRPTVITSFRWTGGSWLTVGTEQSYVKRPRPGDRYCV